MRWQCDSKWIKALAAIGVILFVAATTHAAEPEKIRFLTADYATIEGLYFASDFGVKAPTVMMLPPVGSTIEAPGWTDLAKRLQKEHYAVLTFDYRGHGGSTNVAPQFWTAERTNQSIKGYRQVKPKTSIAYGDFRNASNIVGILNDICAAKRFLDQKNDASECNSARLIVIGAGSGATLGAAWINSEWKRHARKSGFPVVNSPQPEGHDIAAAVWLSMSSSVSAGMGRWSPNLQTLLGSQVRENTPTLFIYGDQDTAAARLAKSLHSFMSKGLKDKKLKDLMREVGIKDTKLSGVELLKSSLRTDDTIVTYLNQVMDERSGNPWAKKEVDRVIYTIFPISYYIR